MAGDPSSTHTFTDAVLNSNIVYRVVSMGKKTLDEEVELARAWALLRKLFAHLSPTTALGALDRDVPRGVEAYEQKLGCPDSLSFDLVLSLWCRRSLGFPTTQHVPSRQHRRP